jgi:hypothetical protein
MCNYVIYAGPNDPVYFRYFDNQALAREWVIAHLDLSLEWTVENV